MNQKHYHQTTYSRFCTRNNIHCHHICHSIPRGHILSVLEISQQQQNTNYVTKQNKKNQNNFVAKKEQKDTKRKKEK